MHFLYYMLGLALFASLVAALFWSHEWLNGSYKKSSAWVKWLAFLPISIARAGLIAAALFINTLYLFPIRESIAQCINWIVVPVFFFYTISLTIPRGKKVVPMTLCTLWMILGVLSILNGDPHVVIRGIQVVALAYFLFLWAKIPTEDLYK